MMQWSTECTVWMRYKHMTWMSNAAGWNSLTIVCVCTNIHKHKYRNINTEKLKGSEMYKYTKNTV